MREKFTTEMGQRVYQRFIGMNEADVEAMYDAAMAADGTNADLLALSTTMTTALIALIHDKDRRHQVEADVDELVEILQRDAFTASYMTITQQGKLGVTLRTAYYRWKTAEYEIPEVRRIYNLLWTYVKETYSIGLTATPAAAAAWDALREYVDTSSLYAFRLGYKTGRISSRLVSLLASGE